MSATSAAFAPLRGGRDFGLAFKCGAEERCVSVAGLVVAGASFAMAKACLNSQSAPLEQPSATAYVATLSVSRYPFHHFQTTFVCQGSAIDDPDRHHSLLSCSGSVSEKRA